MICNRISIAIIVLIWGVIFSGQIYAVDLALTWDPSPSSDVVTYKVYYGTSSGNYSFSIDAGNVTRYEMSPSLDEGTTYYFAVTAVDAAGLESDYSNEVTYTGTVAAGDSTPPLAPQGVTGEVTGNDVVLSWNANSESDLSGYRVYSGTSTRNYGSPVPVNGTEYSVTGLDSGGTYYFAVTAVDASGNESGFSSPEIVKTIGDLSGGGTADTTAPVVTITSPTSDTVYNTETGTLNIGGTATDESGVTSVSWTNQRGGSGTAVGTSSWSVSGIALAEGENLITVTAKDSAVNASTDTLTVVYAIPDTTAPVVTITSPTSDTVYNTETGILNIGGTAADEVGVTSVSWTNQRGGSGTAVGTNSWSVSGIPLAEGENLITVTAKDGAGNASTDILTIVYTMPDTTAPVVSITSPTTGTSYSTESGSMSLSGMASDDTGLSSVTWSNSRGGSGTAVGTSSWSVTGIALAEGENLFTVTAEDEAGNATTDTLTVVYTMPDTTAPVVTITSPTSDSVYNTETGTLDIGGTAADEEGVSTVTWSNSMGGSGTAVGTSSWSVSGIALVEGENLITVTAEDEAGNASTDTLTVVYTIPDTTAPVVTITSPTSDTAYNTGTATLNIGGTAVDAVGVSAVIWSNSMGSSGTAVGTNPWSVSGITLSEGENLITVTAEDEAGNASTDTLTVVYTIPDTTAPVVTITSPTGDTVYNTGTATLNIGGTATDEVGVTSVSWSNQSGGSGTAVGTNPWRVSGIALVEGENLITVTAEDEAGNASTDTLMVMYTIPDTTAPVVTITSPIGDTAYNTGTATLNIGGTATDAVGVSAVTWSNSVGGSGTAVGTNSWRVSGIALVEGENLITVTAEDEAGNTSTDTLTVVYTIPDTTAPVVTITSPTSGTVYNTGTATLTIGGTATDAVGVRAVTWSNSRGGSGTAVGTNSWSVAGIALAEGENVITVTAGDAAGNNSTDVLTVTYTAPVPIDTEPPVLILTFPDTDKVYRTSDNIIDLKGTASDNEGVKEVRWTNDQGGTSGTANGTTNWEALNVPLANRKNDITITAEDLSGNTTVFKLTVFVR